MTGCKTENNKSSQRAAAFPKTADAEPDFSIDLSQSTEENVKTLADFENAPDHIRDKCFVAVSPAPD